MDDLIFDRTLSDVEEALSNPDSSTFLKGAYNYTDLNRIEIWCEYLQEKLKEYGFNENLEIKNNWSMTDFITRTEIDRIRNNIDILKNFCYALETEEIEYDNTMNYTKANIIEKILYEINEHLKNLSKQINLSEQIGFFIVKKKYIHLDVINVGEE